MKFRLLKNGKKELTPNENFPSECSHEWHEYKEVGLGFGWEYCSKCGLQRFKEENKNEKKI